MRLKNVEKNFELNAGGEGKPMMLRHKRGDVRETRKLRRAMRRGIEDSLDRR